MLQILRKFLLLWTCLVTCLAAQAAQATDPFNPADPVLGGWDVRMAQNAHNMPYCIAERAYPGGLQLTIAVDQGQNINLGILVPQAGFGVGENYAMWISVDKSPRKQVTARARTADLMIIDWGEGKEFLTALRNGAVLHAAGTQDRQDFILAGQPGLDRLDACLQEMVALQRVTLLPESLAALLQEAGLSDARPYDFGDRPLDERPADYAWSMGKIFGGVRERQVPPAATMDEIATLTTQAFQSGCAGRFTNRFEQATQIGDATLQKASIQCQLTDREIDIALLYILQKGVFTVYLHQAEADLAPRIFVARDAIARVMEDMHRKAAEQKAAEKTVKEKPKKKKTTKNPKKS